MSPARESSTAVITQSNKQDLERAKLLHGSTWDEAHHEDSFLSKLKNKDRAFQPELVQAYMKHWKKDEPTEETQQDKDERSLSYKAVTNGFYDLATDFYEYAWGTSFHFCRFHFREPFAQAVARHEHYLAAHGGFKSGDRILDIGCGVGGPAREIAHFTGAHITGLNNNDYQINRARRYAAMHGLSQKQEFVKGDFMKMPFDDHSFDACYAIEATVHAATLEGVYGEAFRVLKPGGIFACYEWVMTDKFDVTNPEHQRIVRGIELGNGIAQMRTRKECLKALQTVGFEIQRSEDLVETSQDEIPWYYPIAGDVRQANTLWDYVTVVRTTQPGRKVTTALVSVLEKLHLAAPGSTKVSQILQTAADSLVEAARLDIFTPMFFFVAKKPIA
ncbi:Delta(24)-sterol C-methyltransferase [Actinomortierella ambigua]|nr:Delta(24)-sterol C-methyltransferase [Actinomortierella ambigua]